MSTANYGGLDDGKLLQLLKDQLDIAIEPALLKEFVRRTSVTLLFGPEVTRSHCKTTVNKLFRKQIYSNPKWQLVEPKARFLTSQELDALRQDGRFEQESLSFGITLSPSLFCEQLGSSTIRHITFLKEFSNKLRGEVKTLAVIGPVMITSDPLALNIAMGERDLLL